MSKHRGSKHRAPVRRNWRSVALTVLAGVVPIAALAGGIAVTRPGVAPMQNGPSLLADAVPGRTTSESRSESRSEPASPSASARLAQRAATKKASVALPEDSGKGRRAVFSEGRQRVWIVDANGSVERTYQVSGSVYDNLDPGTYHVYSRSEQAWGVDDSGTMKWFVRFTQGDEGAAIGFHSIPMLHGEPVQTKAQLGTPLSHGCIRQKESDARAMWDFARLGTKVVVTP